MPLGYTTTEDLLNALKVYTKQNLKDSKGIIRTVKAGIIDERDELPMLSILPSHEIVSSIYNDGLYGIDWSFRLDIIDRAFRIEDARESVKKKLIELKSLFSTKTLDWNLVDSEGKIQSFNFELGRETLSEAAGIENSYTQFCSLPLTLSGYSQMSDMVVPTEIFEENYIGLLDYFFDLVPKEFPTFETRWRDISKPISLENFPAIGIFLQEPDGEKLSRTSTESTDLIIIFRIYSSLATREIAFTNHLRNVEKVKRYILQNPSLDGRIENFRATSIDYGIDTFGRAFQGGVSDFPVFRSDITTMCRLFEFKEADV